MQKIENSQQWSGIFPVWKQAGETLAVLLERFRIEHGIGREIKITYAGRLDPAAAGVVLLCVGGAVHQKEALLGLDKEYELTILFGIKTDTADLLGMPLALKVAEPEGLGAALEQCIGTVILPYPRYSSKPVAGKPLFVHARAGRAVPIPSKQIMIKNIELLEERVIAPKTVLEQIRYLAKTVRGDFRQKEIEAAWTALLAKKTVLFKTATLRAVCSSGTYMRSLAELIGERIGLSACAFSIIRTRIGDYTILKP